MSSGYTTTLKKILLENGCRFVRHGKGDHDVWENPRTGRRFTVDHDMKSRHTANAVLKQAGLSKQF
jgi:HicA toxin of bacterial toxin-antitoxin,